MFVAVQPLTLKDLLSKREFQIAALVSEGLKNKEIGSLVRTSEQVVKNYLRVIYDKTGCWSRLELAVRYVREQAHGLYELDSDSGTRSISSEAPGFVDFAATPFRDGF